MINIMPMRRGMSSSTRTTLRRVCQVRPRYLQPRRGVAGQPGIRNKPDLDDMGGPGGQESLPASEPIRRCVLLHQFFVLPMESLISSML